MKHFTVSLVSIDFRFPRAFQVKVRHTLFRLDKRVWRRNVIAIIKSRYFRHSAIPNAAPAAQRVRNTTTLSTDVTVQLHSDAVPAQRFYVRRETYFSG